MIPPSEEQRSLLSEYTPEQLTERLAEAVADGATPLGSADRADLGELLPLLRSHTDWESLALDGDRQLAIAVHMLAFVRRVRSGEHLDPLGDELYSQVPADRLMAARQLIDTYCTPRGYAAPDSEVLLLTLHFEVARQSTNRY